MVMEEDKVWARDETVDRLLAASTSRLVCPNLRNLICCLSDAYPRLISCFLPPCLTHLILCPGQPYLPGVRQRPPNLGPAIQVLPTPCLQELTIDFDSEILDHFKDEISTMIQLCRDSLRTLNLPMYLTEAAVNHILGLKNLRVWLSYTIHLQPPYRSQQLSRPSKSLPLAQGTRVGGYLGSRRERRGHPMHKISHSNMRDCRRPSSAWPFECRLSSMLHSSPRFPTFPTSCL